MKHGSMFLFNGAEEGGLAGSHGFLSHKWFPLVNLVVNLEAAGSGGQEFVFQTGPGHPWILGNLNLNVRFNCKISLKNTNGF